MKKTEAAVGQEEREEELLTSVFGRKNGRKSEKRSKKGAK